jgi:hypothetical protein
MEFSYQTAISGYFEFPTENARRLLPGHLEPVELHHGSSIFSMTAFDVPESPLGPHRQVIMSVVVVPRVEGADVEMPKIAVYPYLVGATLAPVRQLASELWRLPHWNDDVEIDFTAQDRSITAKVSAAGQPVAELTVGDYEWEPSQYLYQCYTRDASGAYVANVRVTGEKSEHEEETGHLILHDHPFNTGLMIGDVYDVPFREVWMRDGTQTFEPLVPLQTA